YLDTVRIEPLPHKSGNAPKIKEEHYSVLQKLVEENNDSTLEELCVQMELKSQVKISRSGMGKTLQKLKLTRKKTLHAAEQDREIIRTFDANNLVFVDESGVKLAGGSFPRQTLRQHSNDETLCQSI
nr:hypothetical protein [Brasilonema bromeliae SPC951]